MNKQNTGANTIGCLIMLAIVIIIVINVFYGAYIRYTEGKQAPFLILLGLVIISGIVILSYNIKNETLGSKIRLLPKVIVYSTAVIFAVAFVGYFIFSILTLPFTDIDASIDMGILIVKSDFVKIVLVVLEVISIIYIINRLKRVFTKKQL